MVAPNERRVARRPLEIAVEIEGDRVPVTVGVTPDVAVLRPTASLIVLRDLPEGESVSVWIARRDGAAFAPRTTVHVTASVTTQSGERDVASFSGTDVSDLTQRELLVVTAAGTEFVLAPAGDDLLPPLGVRATAAYVAARAVAAGAARIQQYGRVRAVVDDSASMRAHLGDGAVLALIEVLTGISVVLAPGADLEVELTGADTSTAVGVASPDLVEALQQSVRDHDPSSGFRLPPLNTSLTGGRELVYVITDGLPPRPRQDFRASDLRVLIMGGDNTASWFRARSEAPVVVVDSGVRSDLLARPEDFDPGRLRTLVTSVVRGD